MSVGEWVELSVELSVEEPVGEWVGEWGDGDAVPLGDFANYSANLVD